MSKSVLIIVTGSIAAYKSLEVIRQLRSLAINATVILSKGGSEFVTPLALAALSGNQVYSDLFSLQDESEMGHIRLSREHDLIAVIPASANIIAKIANGLCDDLASAALLASNKPIIIAPAMNSFMWNNPATLRNIRQLQVDGVEIIEPASGELACGEIGEGKLASVEIIVERIVAKLQANQPLKGLSALVTAGPTFEPIDPVRFIGNRSSGKQGYAIAAALTNAGAKVTLIKGETAEAPPLGVDIINVETAEQMLAACKNALPVDIGVFCAAVADWKV
ncbi:MAG: bifunctional phosphopantothenoylcysteine decarboxylase/phosphopantothenate--cysteine ligase CoaBC, partial [Pseudomonadota bacterium]